MLPMLGMAKQDALKVVFCCGKTVGSAQLLLCTRAPLGRLNFSFVSFVAGATEVDMSCLQVR